MKYLTITIKRREKESSYKVPFIPKMRILDALLHIQEHLEPDLAFRWNCGEGICGSCAAEVNGKPLLLCKTEITPEIKLLHIDPLRVFPVIKDIVVDPKSVYEKLAKIKPYFNSTQKNSSQKSEFFTIYEDEITEAQEMRKCINCFICYDSCHVLRSKHDVNFVGPMNIVKAVALDKHPHEKSDRSLLLEKEGLWHCTMSRCCSDNCPQNIKIMEDAIIWAKERAVSLYKKRR